jgi:drug/metabolite transporter (DMT)-like permease
MQSNSKGFLLILLSTVGLGLTPFFGKMAFEVDVSTETLLFLRFSFGFVGMFLYLLFTKTKFRISLPQFGILAILGCLYCAQTTLYFSSIKHIVSTLAVMLLYLYPVFVLILSLLFEKKALSKNVIFSMLIALLGIGILLGFPTGKVDIYGVLLAIGSALTYSIYVMVSKRLLTGLSPLVTSTWVIFFTALAFLVSGSFTGHLHFDFAAKGWYAAIALALFSTIISFWAFFAGMKYIGATRASIVSTFEPIVTTISAVLLLDETINLAKILGILMVLASVILLILFDREKKVEKTLPESLPESQS